MLMMILASLLSQHRDIVLAPCSASGRLLIIPPERFAADISDWPRVNEKIIAAQGCVIEGEDFRSGRRQFKKDGVTLKKSPIFIERYKGYTYLLPYTPRR